MQSLREVQIGDFVRVPYTLFFDFAGAEPALSVAKGLKTNGSQTAGLYCRQPQIAMRVSEPGKMGTARKAFSDFEKDLSDRVYHYIEITLG